MKKGVVIGFVVALIAVILALALFGVFSTGSNEGVETSGNDESDNVLGDNEIDSSQDSQETQDEQNVPENDAGNGDSNDVTVVEITSSGFNPGSLTISSGDTVEFVNEDSSSHWPASDVHPTHTAYPGSGMDKCGTAEEDEIFDSCGGLSQGESYSFTFEETGTWYYHDHLNSQLGGEIIVE